MIEDRGPEPNQRDKTVADTGVLEDSDVGGGAS